MALTDANFISFILGDNTVDDQVGEEVGSDPACGGARPESHHPLTIIGQLDNRNHRTNVTTINHKTFLFI